MKFPVLKMPDYTNKDFAIMVATMLPFAVLLNYFLYGQNYFYGIKMFFIATSVTFIITSGIYMLYGIVAVLLRNRYPADRQVGKRIIFMIAIFLLMSLVVVSTILKAYEFFGFYNYSFDETHLQKSFVALGIMNIFLVFLHEGVSRFQNYKAASIEIEQLKNEYMRSQLISLRSQANPHFLFNSLNSLSSLIHENPEKAERFLDEMSKVYRYLLRISEIQLIDLKKEISFLNSYCYLLKERLGEALQVTIQIDEGQMEYQLPPLTLQMLLETAVNENLISRSQPLQITVNSIGKDWIEIRHNVQPKIGSEEHRQDVKENIANKFRLLTLQDIKVMTSEKMNIIQLPLSFNTEKIMA